MTVALAAALASCVLWGTADFVGGVASRRVPALVVVWVAMLVGSIGLLLTGAAAAVDDLADGDAALSAVGGGADAIGLTLLMVGLRLGQARIVSPLSACGAVVAVVGAVVLGDAPPLPMLVALALAGAGIVLASIESEEEQASAPALRPRGAAHPLVLGIGAALSFGAFYLLLGRASTGGGDPAALALASRAGGFVALSVVAVVVLVVRVVRRRADAAAPEGEDRWRPALTAALVGGLAVGLGDTLANVLFVVGASAGSVVLVTVVAAMYPAVTVALARVLLAEPMGRVQVAGVALMLCGVAAAAPFAPAG